MRNVKETVKDEILLAMRNHIDSVTMNILNEVINKALANVEMNVVENLPATVDDTNNKIIELYKMRRSQKLSQKTMSYYLNTIDRLICFTNKSLLRINSTDIEMFLSNLSSSNSPTSLNNLRRNLASFFNWMRKSHMIIDNPCENIESYKEIHKPIDHMTIEDYEQLKSGCEHVRDRALIETLRSTAMRVGELQNIRVSDVDWRTGKVTIYAEKTHSYRPVCLDSLALKYLRDYILEKNISFDSCEPLFTSSKSGKHTALSCAGIRGILKVIAKKSNISRRIYPHLFRKTTATNIVKRGGSMHDASEYLGHKDRTTAGTHYVYINEQHTIDIFNKYVAAI